MGIFWISFIPPGIIFSEYFQPLIGSVVKTPQGEELLMELLSANVRDAPGNCFGGNFLNPQVSVLKHLK